MKKPWELTKKKRDEVRKHLATLSRSELETKYLMQHALVFQFLWVVKKLKQTITELELLR